MRIWLFGMLDLFASEQGFSGLMGTTAPFTGRKFMYSPSTGDLPAILVVDDEKNMRLSLRSVLTDAGYSVKAVESAEEALSILGTEEYLMVLSDARMGGMSGYELLNNCQKQWPELPFVLITSYGTPRLAVDAIKAGAMDYLTKPFAIEELLHMVGRCGERYRLLKENAMLRASVQASSDLNSIVGNSAKISELRWVIQAAAKSNATVLIAGESGTGKELIAGAIHALSLRKDGPYVKLNCAAIPEALLESELFGYEKGAFTGALKQKSGRVEEAHRGTLFLDEIGDMNAQAQAKLLRFLEDGSFSRLGGNRESRVDVRVVAATNRDLSELMRNRQFREDLYHRLNVIRLCPPPLRERPEDVPLLVAYFLQKLSLEMGRNIPNLDSSAERALSKYGFPGNVRELKNIVERALIFCGEVIRAEHLHLEEFKAPPDLAHSTVQILLPDQSPVNLEKSIQIVAQEALRRTNGNLSAAARLMGIHRSKLNRILVRGLDEQSSS